MLTIHHPLHCPYTYREEDAMQTPRPPVEIWKLTPYGQKTRIRLDSRVCDPAIAQASACILSTASCILDAT